MIAVILAAGKGSRMGLRKPGESKCMLSIEGEPVLHKKVRELAALSCVEKIIVVVRKEDDRIREELGSSCDNVPIAYAIQEEGHPGLVNALYSVPDYKTWAGQTISLNLGDEYYRSLDYQELAARHRSEGAELTLVLTPTADRSKVCRNYTVDLAEDGRVLYAVEKPDHPFNSYMGCGTLVMEGDFLVRYAHEAENSCPEGGYEGQNLTDWIQRALQEGRCCRTYLYEDMYCNLNTREDYLYLRAFAGEERIREFVCREGGLGLVPGKGSRISQEEIRDRLLEVMAEYEFPPRIFLACDGKLPDLGSYRCEWDHPYREADTWLEQAICQIWKKLLRLDQVGADDNFFHLGGNYAMALQLVREIRCRLHMRIPVSCILVAETTVRRIAQNVESYFERPGYETFTDTEHGVSLL